MTDYKTMRVPEDAWEQAQAYRKEHGLTWGEYIRPPCDNSVETTEPMQVVPIEDVVGHDVPTQQLDLSPLIGRIDDLETELKTKIENETPNR